MTPTTSPSKTPSESPSQYPSLEPPSSKPSPGKCRAAVNVFLSMCLARLSNFNIYPSLHFLFVSGPTKWTHPPQPCHCDCSSDDNNWNDWNWNAKASKAWYSKGSKGLFSKAGKAKSGVSYFLFDNPSSVL